MHLFNPFNADSFYPTRKLGYLTESIPKKFHVSSG